MGRSIMINIIYIVFASAVLIFYAITEFSGWEFNSPPRRIEAADRLARLIKRCLDELPP